MFSYKPFYQTLLKKGITEYQLIFKHGINASTLHRIRRGDSVTIRTIDELCEVLDCNISDIVEHINED